MDLKELNHAGEHAIFGSIEVLGDIDGKGMRTIRREINSMHQQQASFTKKFENYWSDLSSDGVITPVEKASLLKEWEGITQSYTALYEQASEKQLINTQYWQDYVAAFQALKTELFTTEKIFDNMYETTTLSDKDDFNTIFSEYYYAEKFVQLAITTGIIDKLGLRGLTSLEEEGYEGELAFYRGELYQMHNSVWVKIGTQTYLGILDHYDPDFVGQPGQYFLARGNYDGNTILLINNKKLLINDSVLLVKFIKFKNGKLYYWDNQWRQATDDDPRYVAVLADYMSLTGELPELLKNEIIQEVSTNISVPEYLGVSDTAPVGVKEGDWFYYTGITTGETEDDWIKGRIHVYKDGVWKNVRTDDPKASEYYMIALQDILSYESAGDGYFSTAFCNAFFANKASINALKVHTIYLENTGAIESANYQYTPTRLGMRLDAQGNADFNGTTHIGGTCTIDGTTTIGGNTTIGGVCNVDKLHFSRTYSPSETNFSNGDLWMVS